MVPALRAVLAPHRGERPYAHDQPVFATRTGRPNRPDNIRTTIIAPAFEQANELLIADDRAPLAHLTPHTLRRTFAWLVAELGVPPRRVMYLLGHESPTLTLAIYEQVLDLTDGGLAVLEDLLGAPTEQLVATLTGRTAGAKVSGKRPAIENRAPRGAFTSDSETRHLRN